MCLLERNTFGEIRVRGTHGDSGRLGDIVPLVLLNSKSLANDGTLSRCSLQSRDSVSTRGRLKRGGEHSQGCRAAAFQERTDLLALAKKRFHSWSELNSKLKLKDQRIRRVVLGRLRRE